MWGRRCAFLSLQITQVEDLKKCCLLTSEVPQGSLLCPVLFVLFIEKLLRVYEEKDLGVVISDKLTWDPVLHLIIAKANKLLGFLKRSCPMLTKVAVRKVFIIIKQLWNLTFVTLQNLVSRSEVTKTWGWTSLEACHQVDFKFEDRPDVMWGENAYLGYAASYLR